MKTPRVPSLVFVIGIALCSSAPTSIHAQVDAQVKFWAGITVAQPVFRVGATSQLSISFAIVNDGDRAADPGIGASHLFINGAEPKDWGMIINNGLRSGDWKNLRPSGLISFGYQLGDRFFSAPGIYTVRWEGANFRSSEITFRVLPG